MTEPRDEALQALYEADQREADPTGPFGAKARRLIDGVIANRAELDLLIEDASEGWSVPRMPVVDRTVLRIATFELVHERSTPPAVILSEAVRLAKTYSTEKSGRFVNGVLATIAAEQRP